MNQPRTECEVKVAGTLELAELLARGGELLGQSVQKDHYLAGHDHARLREEQGQFTFTRKSAITGILGRVRGVTSEALTAAEAGRLLRESGVRVQVCKSRTTIRLADVVVRLDEVEHLGSFVEISAADEQSLEKAIGDLGLAGHPLIREGYQELMAARELPRWLRAVLRAHDRIGELTFGITSGILTTVGVLVGVNSATSSRLSVVAAVVAIAVADSCSDAFGIYLSKASERGASHRQALRLALGTLLGKAFLPVTFLGPLLALPLGLAVWVNLAWAALVLTLLSAEQAVVEQRPILPRVARNLGLTVLIVGNSALAGWLVAGLRE